MKHFTGKELGELGKIERANLINSVTGCKPANLIGTIGRNERANLAIFSSVVHLGANPPLIGFVQRPIGKIERHTYENILDAGVYTINHVQADFVERAHYTSAKFDRETSEFAACGLTEEFLDCFAAPFVAESRIKIGLRFVEEIPIKINGTILIVGEIEHLFLPEHALFEDGNLDLNAVRGVCVSGLETYHEVRQIARFSFARPTELPDFEG